MATKKRKGDVMTYEQKKALFERHRPGVEVLVTGAQGKDFNYLRKQRGFSWDRNLSGFVHRLQLDSPRLIWVDDDIAIRAI